MRLPSGRKMYFVFQVSAAVFLNAALLTNGLENLCLHRNGFVLLSLQIATLFKCDACQHPCDPHVRHLICVLFMILLQANRTPAESTSHSTSHSITPPPSTTYPFVAVPSTHVVEEDPKPLVAISKIDAATLRNQQAESVISGLAPLKFMLSNEFVTT